MNIFIQEGLDKLARKHKVTAKDMGDFTDEALKQAANMATSSALNVKREAVVVVVVVAVAVGTIGIGVIVILVVVVELAVVILLVIVAPV